MRELQYGEQISFSSAEKTRATIHFDELKEILIQF